MGTVIAVALLGLVAGCWGSSFLAPPRPACSQVVACSVAVASATLEEELSRTGAVLLERPEREGIALVGTISGKKFLIDLRSVKEKGSDKSTVVFQWASEPDEQFTRTVQDVLTGMAPPQDSGVEPLVEK
jgi:hypothetical protein